jgi:hypothetical protein
MKQMQWVLLVLLQLGVVEAQAQKTINDPNARVREVGKFLAISVSSAIDLHISQGSQSALAISASEEKYLENITTEVRNNTLYIGYKGGSGSWGPKYMRAYVSVPDLNRISASGACNVIMEGAFNAKDLEISISGASDFKGTVKATNLKLSASGSSDFIIEGSAINLRADVSGSSDLKGFGLAADYCDVEASGASDINITANKELKVRASGSSDVFYRGDAVIREISSSGASDIKKRT